MIHCTHKVGNGAVYSCSNTKMHVANDTVWERLCLVCPLNDNGVRTVPAKDVKGAIIGPGLHLKKIFDELDIHPTMDCNCTALQNRMDQWGLQGCRDHLDEICTELYTNWKKWKIGKRGVVFQQVVIAKKLLAMGIIPNPLDPVRSIVVAAISRAEKQSTQPP